MDDQLSSVVNVGSKNIVGQNFSNVGNQTYIANQNIRVGVDQDRTLYIGTTFY